MKNITQKIFIVVTIFFASIWADLNIASSKIDLLEVQTKLLQSGKAQIMLSFSGDTALPTEFSLDEPSKMIFDFAYVSNKIPKKVNIQSLSSGIIKNVNFVEVEDKTRMIIDVLDLVKFKTEKDGNNIIITLDGNSKLSADDYTDFAKTEMQEEQKQDYSIKAIDFRRGENGEGKLVLDLASNAAPIDFSESDNEMTLEYIGGTIPDKLLRRFDVSDFGTPIKRVVVMKKDGNIVFKIQVVGEYEKVAYQLDNQYVIEVKPVTSTEKEFSKAQKFKFTGEKISLNFQDIEVRAVLQLLADFTGLNIVASDSVKGNITLKLDNVPWDQALDFILKSKGLGKRESGNILLIAPMEEIAAKEQLEIDAEKKAQTLAPLQSKYVQINYAKAADIEKTLKSDNNSVLSERGVINVDERTNTLLIKDIPDKLSEALDLIAKLDIPIRQVIIEAQIVQTSDNFSDAFGLQMAGATKLKAGKYPIGIGGDIDAAQHIVQNNKVQGSYLGDKNLDPNDTRSFFDLKATGDVGKLGLAIGKLPGGTILDLELRASETEAKSKVLARPKLMTLDQQTATIETGREIPYGSVAQEGSTATYTFKKAVLKLEVTPQITPNDQVLMALSINNDTMGGEVGKDANPAINTTNVKTNVLVDNGETIVLGGIFTVNQSKTVKRIPFFSDIPFLGRLFKDDSNKNDRQEILIFVTPKVVKPVTMN